MDTRTKNARTNVTLNISKESFQLIEAYLQTIQTEGVENLYREKKLGRRLREVLKDSDVAQMTTIQFIDALQKTKKPRIFAEYPLEVRGNGSDWTLDEISLMGRIATVIKDVTVFSKSTYNPTKADLFLKEPRPKTDLLFINGALLAGCGADKNRVTNEDGSFSQTNFDKFLEENLLPSLLFQNANKGGVVTLPILGGKSFAGDYEDEINKYYKNAVENLLTKYRALLPNITGVVITGLNTYQKKIGHIQFITTTAPCGLYPQSVDPTFANKPTGTGIAGDCVSFPCNDLYENKANTHEGGVTARTNCMTKITGVKGKLTNDIVFIPETGGTWEQYCAQENTTLVFDTVNVFDMTGNCQQYSFIPSDSYKPRYLDPMISTVTYKGCNQYGALLPFSDIRNDDYLIKVRFTIGNIIKNSALDLVDPVGINITTEHIHFSSRNLDDMKAFVEKVDPDLKINDTGNGWYTVTFGLEDGLKLIKEFTNPYEYDFKFALNGQNLTEHLLLIALEEHIVEELEIHGWSDPKPYFNHRGELIYTPHKQAPIILDLNDFKASPLIEQIKKFELDHAMNHTIIMHLKLKIETTTWKSTDWLGKTIETNILNNENPNNLPNNVKMQLDKINEYLENKNPNPAAVIEELKKFAKEASKETKKSRHSDTVQYYKDFDKLIASIRNDIKEEHTNTKQFQ